MLVAMSVDPAPREVRQLAEARKVARDDRDWAEADRLKQQIEAAGWKVVDQGRSFDLIRARPPDLELDGIRRYGGSASVPARLGEPPRLAISVIGVVENEGPAAAFLAPADDVELVLVANGPINAAGAALRALPAAPADGSPIEVIWTNGRFGRAAALNAGIRRARGRTVVLADPARDLSLEQVRAVAAALDDEGVGVAGGAGLRSQNLRDFEPATPAGDATSIDGRLLAFRRDDYVARGPLDEHFADPHRLDTWWSLVLRDEGPDRPPRRARVVDVGLEPPAPNGRQPDEPTAGHSRAERRNFYRLIRDFGGRRDLGSG